MRPPAEIARIVARAVGMGFVVLLVATSWWWWPTTLGGQTAYVFVSGNSMEPTFSSGDLVVVRHGEDVAVGDAAVFEVPAGEPGAGVLVIHRVVVVNDDGTYTFRGDNRERDDQWAPTAADLVGVEVAHLPGAGTAALVLRNPLVLAGVAGLLTFAALVVGGRKESDAVDAASRNTPVAR